MTSLDDLRQLEHTGRNRCWPCTLVNALAVALVAAVLGRRRKLLGLAVGAVGVGLVYLRGYVLPYTPAFAPRLVAASPLPDDWFHRDADSPAPGQRGGLAEGDVDGEELLGRLAEAGVLVVAGETVDLDPAFADAWEREMDELAALDSEELAEEAFTVAHAAEVSVVEGDYHEWIVLSDGSDEYEGETWLARPVAIAETAAVRALPEELDEATRRAAAGPLRTFLTECPDCGAALRESSAASCCGGYTNPTEEPANVLECPDCRLEIYRFDDE